MTQSTLTEAEAKKLKQVIGRVQGLPKDDKGKANTERFADKYLRFKLGRRGTGPHSHGLSEAQRKNLKDALHKAFGIKVAERKAAAAPAKGKAPAKAKAKGKAPAKGRVPAGTPGVGPRPTSELAGAQQARAQQTA